MRLSSAVRRYHSAFHPKAQIFFDWQVFWLKLYWNPSHWWSENLLNSGNIFSICQWSI